MEQICIHDDAKKATAHVPERARRTGMHGNNGSMRRLADRGERNEVEVDLFWVETHLH